jgi:mRNA interferase MazF
VANYLTRGKISLVPFSFDDLSAIKLRPAICLTEPIGVNRHIVVPFVTSREVADLLPTDIALPTDHSDFHATGLRVNSVLRLHRLMTLSAIII